MKFLLVAVVLALSRPLAACCMVPRHYKGDVDQAEQQVLILHANGHQEMVIRVAPFFQVRKDVKPGNPDADFDAVGTPDYITWVLTVPSKPTGYAVADKAVFKEGAELYSRLQELARQQNEARSRFSFPATLSARGVAGNSAGDAGGPPGIAVSKPVFVGPYTIIEVKALGLAALDELNVFLDKNGFPTEDVDHMRYFVENNFTFLAIKITPPEGQAKLGKHLDLEALQVGFDTPKPYYPGKFSSRQGNFGLNLTVLTSAPLQRESLNSLGQRLNDYESGYANLWTVQPLSTLLAKSAGAFKGIDQWYVNVIASKGFNPLDSKGDPTIWQWKDDVFFALGGEDDGPPSWYYGDHEIGGAERAWREHAILIVFAAIAAASCTGLLGFGFLRKRRKAKPPAK